MTFALFNPPPLPLLSPLWNATQGAFVAQQDVTLAVSSLRQQLGTPGAMGMNKAEQTRVVEALDFFEQEAVRLSDDGVISGSLIRPTFHYVARSFPARWAYRHAETTDLARAFPLYSEEASGGCGRIYSGRSAEDGRDVAIKVADVGRDPRELLPGVQDEGVSQDMAARILRREYENYSRMPEGVGPKAMAFGTLMGKPAMVLEWLPGEELKNPVGRLRHSVQSFEDLQRLIGIGTLAVDQIAAVHASGLVHRDIKPENFMVFSPRVNRHQVRMFDLGISRDIGEFDAMITGTPAYMSPESFDPAVAANPRRDVWALGAMLYWLVTGEDAYSGDTKNEEIIAKIVDPNFQPKPPSEVVRDTRPELYARIPKAWWDSLDRVIGRAMDRKLHLRYADAATMLRAIRLNLEPAAPLELDLSEFEQAVSPPPPPPSRDDRRTVSARPGAVPRVARRQSVG